MREIVKLMMERRAFGIKEYGVPVSTEVITPIYLQEEALDGAVYARALALKQEGVTDSDVWARLATEVKAMHYVELPRCESYDDAVKMMIALVKFCKRIEIENQ